jgi:hypothetical protein
MTIQDDMKALRELIHEEYEYPEDDPTSAQVSRILDRLERYEKALLDAASYDSGDGVDAFADVIRGCREALEEK